MYAQTACGTLMSIHYRDTRTKDTGKSRSGHLLLALAALCCVVWFWFSPQTVTELKYGLKYGVISFLRLPVN